MRADTEEALWALVYVTLQTLMVLAMLALVAEGVLVLVSSDLSLWQAIFVGVGGLVIAALVAVTTIRVLDHPRSR